MSDTSASASTSVGERGDLLRQEHIVAPGKEHAAALIFGTVPDEVDDHAERAGVQMLSVPNGDLLIGGNSPIQDPELNLDRIIDLRHV